jgi:hypothetical protein
MGEPPIIPYAKLPEPMALPPRMTLPVPSAPLPSYQPLVLPSAEQIRQMRADEETSQQDQEQKPKELKRPPQLPIPIRLPAINTPDKSSQIAETTKVTLPGTDVKITVPKAEVLTTAAATAGVAALASVAATMAAGPVLQNLQKVLKPAMKTALKKLAAIRSVPTANLYESDAKLRWRQRVHIRRRAGGQV